MTELAVARPPVSALAQLVRRAQHGDAEAFDALVRPRLDAAFRLAVAIVGSEADARDAVQEAFVAAWRTLPGLRNPERFDGWLHRILVNACRMSLRHRRVVHVREIPVGPHVPARDGPDLEDVEPVRAALRRLDPDARLLLVLHHLDDRPVAEIAELLGAREGTVKWRLHQARRALEQALQEEWR